MPQGLHSHVTVFCKENITLMEGASESCQLITKEKYTTILAALVRIHNGEPVKLLRSIYPQIYKWCKNYALVTSDETFILKARPHDAYGYAAVEENVNMETVKRLTYFEAAYSDIKRAHGQDHMKGRMLHAYLGKQFENIDHQLCKLFTNLCPICHETGLLNIELLGLQEAYLRWVTTKVNSEWEMARNESLFGGQGNGDVTFNC